MSEEMINIGIKRARQEGQSSSFIPGPSVFAQWCKPSAESHGLPSRDTAFQEARNECGKGLQSRRWSHPAVFLAAAETRFFELRTLQDNSSRYREIKAQFIQHYEKLVERVRSGEQLEIPEAHRIEQSEPIFLSKEENHQRTAQLLAILDLE